MEPSLPSPKLFRRPARVQKYGLYGGVALVSCATLFYEILLTRIFSVVLWYHYAFLVVSLALFGMTIGALIVFLVPKKFTKERTAYHLTLYTFLFAICTALSLFAFSASSLLSTNAGIYLLLMFVIAATPFVFSGICITLALTRNPKTVGGLYAADLIGAAFGCIAVVATLSVVDAATALLIVSITGVIGTLLFSSIWNMRTMRRNAIVSLIVLACLGFIQAYGFSKQQALFKFSYVKQSVETDLLFERWNAYSRVAVYDVRPEPGATMEVRRASDSLDPLAIKKYKLNIDGSAATSLLRFNGDLSSFQYLKQDVVNIGHYLRANANVLIIGSGGGRDIISGLVFGQKSITGVEINRTITDALRGRFGEFTGHLDRYPNVTIVNDEARSFIERNSARYDLMQISLIDTWAATTAGAFTMTENGLYTVEGWNTLLDHLTPNGILSVTRWYTPEYPNELYRLISLAATTLRKHGIDDPQSHIAVVAGPENDLLATILVSPSPFTPDDQKNLAVRITEGKFSYVNKPTEPTDDTIAALLADTEFPDKQKVSAVNLDAPTDDKPFFFQMLKFSQFFRFIEQPAGLQNMTMDPVFILGNLFVVILVIMVLVIIIPLMNTPRGFVTTVRTTWRTITFFTAIGFGFMLIEIAMMERLFIFLGNPTYGISVVLATLLVAGGIGSALSGKALKGSRPVVTLSAIIVIVATVGLSTVPLIELFRNAGLLVRVAVAVGIMAPVGIVMGMAFPLGMRHSAATSPELSPWFWGINGAASVSGSVIAMVIAITGGISATYWAGLACYVIALTAAATWPRPHLVSNSA